MSSKDSTPDRSALFVSAFIDELLRLGVRDVVVSPGSRSTPLAMVAHASDLNLYVDVDERGAAFFALGLAKASGRPVCVICTSGTAVGNYYPAVLEAESSRVPLIVLTGDRPPRLQNLGAPQTCDQLALFGQHVKHFQQMSLPGDSAQEIAFARQMALVAFSKAVGSEVSLNEQGESWYGCVSDAGPVHFNFPFEEPLKPNLQAAGLFEVGRRALDVRGAGAETADLLPLMACPSYPDAQNIEAIKTLMQGHQTLVLCGEGSCTNKTEADLLLEWARAYHLPLLADPLSGLRSYSDPLIIDNYDNIFGAEGCPEIDLVIRFGRYPVSKTCCVGVGQQQEMQIVVDAVETRDFTVATDVFLRCTPAAFVASCLWQEDEVLREEVSGTQKAYLNKWIACNKAQWDQITSASSAKDDLMGAFVSQLLQVIPDKSCLFSASSMSIRLLDTFYLKQEKRLTVLCNRGLNGIDGTLSSALGASQCFSQTTFLTGDLALLHDMNAFALQREILLKKEKAPCMIVVLLNNNGGGIFETLPQRSEEDYFERLFLTPQDVNFSALAEGFRVPFALVESVDEFAQVYQGFLGKPGIHLIEVALDQKNPKD